MCATLAGFLAAGCTAFHVDGHIQRGRAALLLGDSQAALFHFQRVAELDPDYLLDFSLPREGIWTYVGRAHYARAEFAQARKFFERASSRHADDNLARLYLGLVHAREGNRRQGVSEIQAGLTGLQDWLSDIDQYSPDRAFWDPGHDIRSEIRRNLEVIAAKEIDWPKLIGSGESLGKKFEEEIDRAREDKRDDLYRKDGGDGGLD